MLHVVLLVFFIFFLICGIETYSLGENKNITHLTDLFAHFYLHYYNCMLLGVNPSIKYARVNDTFEISCFVPQPGGKLDFYDGDALVPESFIKVQIYKIIY